MDESFKKILRIISILPLLVIFGCAHYSTFFTDDYNINKTKEVTVGSVIIAWEYGVKNDYDETIIDGIRKELSYSGISLNVLHISYREFSLPSTYARQPFYQELQYDISSPKVITFQDIRIQVDSADQQKIRFTVIQGPSKAEFGVTGKIGINFDPDGTITEIARNTPASIAGLKEGDKILRIDGELIPKNNITALLSMITGKPGTTVILVVDRAGNELSFTIKRKKM